MTVKIVNKELFKMYQCAMAENISDWKRVAKLAKFIDKCANGDVNSNYDDLANVVDAILDHEDVELYPQKYRVKLKGLVDSFGQQYVTRLKNGDSYFACGEKKNAVVRDELIQKFTQDEVNYIMQSVIQATVEEVK